MSSEVGKITQMAAIMFSDRLETSMNFNDHEDIEGVLQTIDNLKYHSTYMVMFS